MSTVISNFGAESSVALADNGLLGVGSVSGINRMVPTMAFKVSRRFENGVFHISRLCLNHSTKAAKGSKIGMTLVDERIAHGRDVRPSDILAYDLVQGAHVRWSYIMDKSVPDPPTAVLLHGILGSRKNWGRLMLKTCVTGTFARRLAQEFPTWQNLRCHGDSTAIKKRGPHTLGQLRLTPRVVVGHSFGGKVALSMLDQTPKPLARPVRVWVLDATPGKVRAGGDGDDRPFELISFLRTLPKEGKVASKKDLVDSLVREGFSKDVAQRGYGIPMDIQECGQIEDTRKQKLLKGWVVTNLRQSSTSGSSPSSFSWVFDLNGIAEMYESYEATNLCAWKIVEDVPRGVHVNFLKAERSLHRWALEDLQRIHTAEELAADEGGGVEMHVLEDAGHWDFRLEYCMRSILLFCFSVAILVPAVVVVSQIQSQEEGFICRTNMATLGGIHDSHSSNQNTADIDNLARFAIQEHNKKENTLFEFVRVVKAQEQVVAGTLHHITLEAPWMNFKEFQEFKHAGDVGDTPALTPSDLGVKKDGHSPGWQAVPTHDPVVHDAAHHAVKTIQQRSNSLFPYELQEIVHAKAEVMEESGILATASMRWKIIELSGDLSDMVSPEHTNWLFDYGLIEDISVPDPNFSAPTSGFCCRKETGSKKRPRPELCGASSSSKACREKLRRDRLNDKFVELGSILEPGRPPKTDKAAILVEAIRLVIQLRGDAQKLKDSNLTLQEKIKELKAEKNELRDEKQRLKAEKER
ncbi:unnamed protein product [Camellia sinensis]